MPYAQWLPHTVGKRILAYWSSLLHPSSSLENLSAAQRCNSDVLDGVFSHLDRITLAKVSRVCRGWQPPASVKLYYDVPIEAWRPTSRTLADTLTAQPGLRRLVRHVTLDHRRPEHWNQPPFDWLALLPEHSLLLVTLRTDIFAFPEAACLLDYPAIRTVPHMFARAVYSSDSLVRIMNMPHLQTLAIKVMGDMSSSSTARLKPALRKLAISSYRYEAIVERILQSFDSPLERFTLLTTELKESDLASLQNGLKRHAPSLRYLSFVGKLFFPLPFMDDYILSFPSLETLVCPFGTYTPLLISRLPHTLSTLVLLTGMTTPFAGDDYAAALEQYRVQPRALSELFLDTFGTKQECSSLMATCARLGLSLRILERNHLSPFLSPDRDFQ